MVKCKRSLSSYRRGCRCATCTRLNSQYQQEYRARNPGKRRDEARARHYRRLYGITVEQYDEMLDQQSGVCAVCGAPPTTHRLAVDHCHESGRVRGLLCANCNTGIGKLNDDPALLRKALNYLERGHGRHEPY